MIAMPRHAFLASLAATVALLCNSPIRATDAIRVNSNRELFVDDYLISSLVVEFHREYRDHVRDIMTCSSADFAQWSEPGWLEYKGAPHQHLSTYAISPNFRAPQRLVELA